MNRFLDRLAVLYAPLGRRGLLMDGQYRFAPDADRPPVMRRRPAPARPGSGKSTKTTRELHA
ncbi:hypothetical protein C8J98_101792 [Luteibacter sp. OK325]|nr:hypothetical protein C8J98_101792 [Luteibacter sp. OK325]